MKHLDKLSTITDQYDVIFCDVWGVIHNGVEASPSAVNALQLARHAGKKIILITNSPRRDAAVIEQLSLLKVSEYCYDSVVTSGDVTRDLIAEAPRKIFHIGPDRDLTLYDGLDVELSEEFEAQAVVVTGLFDDRTEKPEDYKDILKRMRARDLPMICANPDIVVHIGDELIWCAGALARDYTMMGGRTFVAGKPHHPIYNLAMRRTEEVLGKIVAKNRILAIGDGILTDIKGAEQFGIDALFITGGIHQSEYIFETGFERAALDNFLSEHSFNPVAFMEALQ